MYLLDSGFLYAVFNRSEQQHETALKIIRGIHESVLLPVPAITETAYLLARDIGPEAVATFLEYLTTGELILESPEQADYSRAAEIIRQYADAEIDFVDALIVAIAERLSITRILTLDQRDFRIIRPRHCSAFELLP